MILMGLSKVVALKDPSRIRSLARSLDARIRAVGLSANENAMEPVRQVSDGFRVLTDTMKINGTRLQLVPGSTRSGQNVRRVSVEFRTCRWLAAVGAWGSGAKAPL